ncbi:hypothetical protein SARC_09748 [Sphaeroforma arctica JP610]|uniref:Uncharacterized protein n=1 Tax=Sphaeroforma arctica JP610 TaxID=667725 RepID=A0A0L0FM18_9EUKA|nr:hypothetical protein SARC_09748 [Sphaeroforma arctica JP610]KNC77800.1 hypothetical protein SARC_09748 [Sphaeroforma arctica JP610]|eukprot:XP_014151702.1 hypothetical protein SARC_09748 [Sphaeroforma arctica JP610]
MPNFLEKVLEEVEAQSKRVAGLVEEIFRPTTSAYTVARIVDKQGLTEFLIWSRNTYVQCNGFVLTYTGSARVNPRGGRPVSKQELPGGPPKDRDVFDTGLPVGHTYPRGFRNWSRGKRTDYVLTIKEGRAWVPHVGQQRPPSPRGTRTWSDRQPRRVR